MKFTTYINQRQFLLMLIMASSSCSSVMEATKIQKPTPLKSQAEIVSVITANEHNISRDWGDKRIQYLSPPPDFKSHVQLQCVGNNYWVRELSERTWLLIGGNLNWQEIHPQARNVKNEKYTSPQVGWYCDSNGLFKTEDSGVSWTKDAPNPLSNGKGNLYSFASSASGGLSIIVGGKYRAMKENEPPSPPYFFRIDTKQAIEIAAYYLDNHGNEWKELKFINQELGWLDDIVCIDENQILAKGVVQEGSAIFVLNKVKDEWVESISESKLLNSRHNNNETSSISSYFALNNYLWVCQSNKSLNQFSKQGNKWHLKRKNKIGIEKSPALFFEQLFFKNEQHGFGRGQDKGVYETVNGGISWKQIDISQDVYSITLAEDKSLLLLTKKGLLKLITNND